jgi:decaprenylphospho-beta-D-ribofuranose 2-oxidase
MGLTGVITGAVLRLRPRRGRIELLTEPVEGWDAALDCLATRRDDVEYTVAWFDPRAARGIVTSGTLLDGESSSPRRSRTLPAFTPKLAAHPFAVGMLNQARWHAARRRTSTAVVALADYLHPLDRIANWNEVCGPHGFTQYQCVVADPVALAEVLAELRRANLSTILVTVKAFGAANDGMLSFPNAGWTLAIDVALPAGAAARRELFAALARLDTIVATASGRIYLAKNAALKHELLAVMYPRLEEFRAVRRRLDPDNVLQSDLGRRTGLCTTTRA